MKLSFDEMRNRSQLPTRRWVGCLLSLDPGHTTGYAVWSAKEDSVQLVEAGHLSTWTNADIRPEQIQDILTRYKISHAVMETYQVYEWKSQDHSWSQIPTIQVIGCIKTLCLQHHVSYSAQTAQVAKQFCTDERLTEWGFYRPGFRHARDAIRHGCYFLLFQK